MKKITEIADKLGVKELELYGDNKAKINDRVKYLE